MPLSFCKQSKPSEDCFSTILEGRQAKISIPNVTVNEWVKLNPGTVGFYRTKYPPELLQQFVPSVKNKSLPPLDRLGLLDDLFALVGLLVFISIKCYLTNHLTLYGMFLCRFKQARRAQHKPSTSFKL